MSLDGEGAPVTAPADQPDTASATDKPTKKKQGRPRLRGEFGYIVPKGKLFAIRWREDGKLKQKGGFKTRKEAGLELAATRTGLADGSLIKKRAAETSFATVAKDWLELHSAPDLRSHQDNVERYEKHVRPFFGEIPLAKVDVAKLLRFRASLKAKTITRKQRMDTGEVKKISRPMAPRTVNLIMALVRSILSFAVKNGKIDISPVKRFGKGEFLLSIPKKKIAAPIPTTADAGRLLAELRAIGEETNRPSIFPMLAFLLYTGARRGEAAGMRWEDCDLEQRTIRIWRTYDQETTKSDKERTVGVPPQLASILREYKLADPWKGELMFPDDTGSMYKPSSKIPQNTLRAALARAGLKRIRVHDLRHAFATLFIIEGGALHDLQKQLGHSTPVLTSETYTHTSASHLAAQMDRLSFPAPTNDRAKVIELTAKRTVSAQGADEGERDATADAVNS